MRRPQWHAAIGWQQARASHEIVLLDTQPGTPAAFLLLKIAHGKTENYHFNDNN